MRPEEKKYIFEHAESKTTREIADFLGLKERKVIKFLRLARKKGRKHEPLPKKVESSPAKPWEKNELIFIAIIAIAALGFVVYGNSLGGDFIWDDIHLVRENPYIRNAASLPFIFSRPLSAGEGRIYAFYRPLQMLSYQLDYALWQMKTMGYHLSNVLLHIMVGVGVFWLVQLLFGQWLLALFTGLLFIVHPVHTEAIAYISGRADPLSFLFMLLCLIFYASYFQTKNNSFYLFSLISFIFALFSRENSVVLPLYLLLYHYCFRQKVEYKKYLPFAVILFFYILLRMTVLKGLLVDIEHGTTFIQRIPGFFIALANYVRLLLLPFNLHMEYGNRIFNITPVALAGMGLFGALLVYIVKNRDSRSIVLFSALWFLIGIIPSTNLYPINAYMAEHWLYLPGMGFFLLAAHMLNTIYKNKALRESAIVLSLVIIAFYGYRTIIQNRYWRDPLTLFEYTLRYAPESARVHFNLANEFKDRGDDERAVPLFKKAIELVPTYPAAYNNLGVSYRNIGNDQAAIEAYEKALEQDPRFAKAYNNLGNVYLDRKDYQKAIESFQKAIASEPNIAETYYNLGNVFYSQGNYQEAVQVYKKAAGLNANFAQAFYRLGLAYSQIGQNQEAASAVKEAVKLKSDYIEAYSLLSSIYKSLGDNEASEVAQEKEKTLKERQALQLRREADAYSQQGDKQKAISIYKKALEARPDYAEVYFNLGNIYRDLGQFTEALEAFEKAVEAKPDYAEAYNNLGTRYREIKREQEAMNAFKKAVESNPGLAQAYYNLALGYFYAKDYPLAIENCDKAQSLGYSNPEFLGALEPFRGQK